MLEEPIDSAATGIPPARVRAVAESTVSHRSLVRQKHFRGQGAPAGTGIPLK